MLYILESKESVNNGYNIY